MHSRRRSSSLPVNTVVMGIAGSRRCSSEPAGRWAKTGWSVSGVARGSRFRRSRGHEDGCGSTMVRACGSGPTHRNHVWSYDFVSTRTHDGRSVRLLNLIDEHTRESLLVRAQRRWSSSWVISALADVMVVKGVPEHLRSDNGPEFVAKDLRTWLANTGAKTLYIEPGSPWENGYCESFNSKLRDEFLNGEIFYSIKELRVLAERWRIHYNTIRPHSSLGYRSPAHEVWLTNNTRHGEVETATRFPLPHTPDGGYLKSEIAALHELIQRHKRSGTPPHHQDLSPGLLGIP